MKLRKEQIAATLEVTSHAVERWFGLRKPLPKRTLLALKGAGFRLPIPQEKRING